MEGGREGRGKESEGGDGGRRAGREKGGRGEGGKIRGTLTRMKQRVDHENTVNLTEISLMTR